MPVPWKTYAQRRQINLARWVQKNNIKSYDDFVRVSNAIGVAPPPLSEIKSYLNSAPAVSVPVEKRPVPTSEGSKNTSKEKRPNTNTPSVKWNSLMKKSDMLSIAQSAGLSELTTKNTKAEIVAGLVSAGYPESQI
tara:strand:+ start:23152 stop:23559 length:408 start_codon:yes stop_codon:yes gene_type:complete